jgi:UDPglucose 6-dehydrogenase
MNITVGIIGLGFVGSAIMKSLIHKGYIVDHDLFVYDKYKDGGINTIGGLFHVDIVFIALPTLYDTDKQTYDITAIEKTLEILNNALFKGLVVIKSTMEPLTMNNLYELYNLDIVHNPEFLTARTAFEDFHNQKHIVIGVPNKCNQFKVDLVEKFYKSNYPDAQISVCTSNESEAMKLFLNNFYAVKVQMFTEFYLLCQKLNINYDNVRELMLKNGWINPMHTIIPGPDGKISYGGMCFPKDTQALLSVMKKLEVPHLVLESTIKERDLLRHFC